MLYFGWVGQDEYSSICLVGPCLSIGLWRQFINLTHCLLEETKVLGSQNSKHAHAPKCDFWLQHFSALWTWVMLLSFWSLWFLLSIREWGNQSWELLLQGMMGKCLVSTSHSTQPRTCSYTMVVRALNPSGCPNLLLKPDTNSWKDKQQTRNTHQPGLSQVGPHNKRNGKFPQNPPPCQAVKEQDFSGFAFFAVC